MTDADLYLYLVLLQRLRAVLQGSICRTNSYIAHPIMFSATTTGLKRVSQHDLILVYKSHDTVGTEDRTQIRSRWILKSRSTHVSNLLLGYGAV
jgi:hypothetical protein